MEIFQEQIHFPLPREEFKDEDILREAEEEARKRILESIKSFRDNIDNPSLKLHLDKTNLSEIKDEDLMAFNEIVNKGAWREKTPQYLKYEDRLKKYFKELREKKGEKFNVYEDSRCNFAAMLKNFLIDQGIQEKKD